MTDLLPQFLIEARELVQLATDDLLELEMKPTDATRLDSIFRAVHTLKGSVGLFDLAPMAIALHAGEDLLGAMRDGRVAANRATISILLDLIGQTQRWIHALEVSDALPSDATQTGERLGSALRALVPSVSTEVAGSPATDALWTHSWVADCLGNNPGLSDAPVVAIRYVPDAECFLAGDDPLVLVRSVPELVALRIVPREPWASASEFNPFSCNLIIEAISRASRAVVQPIFRFVPDQVSLQEIRPGTDRPPHAGEFFEPPGMDRGPKSGSASTTLRVDAARIDRLVDLVGELVVAKNTLSFVASQAARGDAGPQALSGIVASHSAIERLVADMHTAVMGMRLLPLRDGFRGLPLAVRDLSIRLGKDVDFAMKGEDVEADKAVVEGLSEPLLHLIRNALDHGIESRDVRVAGGKPARGRIDLRARRSGDKILIELSDDGRGIDPDAIRHVARERGIHRGDLLDAMSRDEAINLIFSPGFSTAGTITDVSGRGVGMDAVRAAVERLGGRVSLTSLVGEGTTVRLVLPVTVLLTKIMVIRVSGDCFGVPMEAVVETARLAHDRIVPIRGGEAFVFRGRTLPLLHLSALLGRDRAPSSGRDLRVLLVSAGAELVGIAVDGFGEQTDVVLKPMTGILAGMRGYAGTTLQGDGSVLIVLDLAELIA
jgi:two-component system, chemotaxis family, sensor kinase CheA